METPAENTQPDPAPKLAGLPRQKRRGVALILVVSFIVLLSALVVSFFSRVSTDLAGARSYAEGVSVRQLADSAVGVVMGNIRAATTVPNGCWASQPGMIRVYGSGTQASSRAYAFYKLYSSTNMVVSGDDLSSFGPTVPGGASSPTDEVPLGSTGWTKMPAFFTDLNEYSDVPNPNPGSGGATTIKRYPIFDPSVARIQALNQNTAANLKQWIEGSEVNLPAGPDLTRNNAPMPVRWMYVLKDGTLTAPKALTGAATGTTGLKAFFDTTGIDGTAAGAPTKDNPIVGRIAFWTDDDTSKVNINTAGGYLLPNGLDEDKNLDYSKSNKTVPETNPAFYAGSFWDTPRVQTYFDRGKSGKPDAYRPGLANSQPVRNEFQRYPGHPSTTSLGLIFKYLLPPSSGFDSEKLYTLTPRLVPGLPGYPGSPNQPTNSMGGTKQLVSYELEVNPSDYSVDADPPSPKKYTYPNPTKGLPNGDSKTYHLLTSVDEFLYSTLNGDAGSNGDRKTAESAVQLKANTITPELIDRSRFFLTAHNRAPELNLFGRPRVSIWPVPTKEGETGLLAAYDPSTKQTGIRNPSDELLRFCSTVGGDITDTGRFATRKGQFIFNRFDPFKGTGNDSDFNLPRNKKIFEYLQKVTSSSTGLIPGWGASFEAKYGQAQGGRDQILTEIFDYIRTVNLKDTSRDERIDKAKGGKNAASEKLKQEARYAKRGIVVPTRVKIGSKELSGFGRFPTVTEASLVFYVGGYVVGPKGKKGTETVEYDFRKVDKRRSVPGPDSDAGARAFYDPRNPNQQELKAKLIRAFLVLETFNPMQGYGPVTSFSSTNQERIVYKMLPLPTSAFRIQTKSMTGGAQPLNLGAGENNVSLSSGDTWGGRNFGGTEGFFHTLKNKAKAAPAGATAYPAQLTGYYPFQTPCANETDGVRVEIKTLADGTEVEDTEFDFTGGKMKIEIRYMDKAHDTYPAHNELVQTLELDWPNATGWPLPITERESGRGKGFTNLAQPILKGEGFRLDTGGFYPDATVVPGFNSNDGTAKHKWSNFGGFSMAYSLPKRIGWAQLHSWNPWTRLDAKGNVVGDDKNYGNRFLQILQPGDTIRSLVPGGSDGAATDPRVIHLQQTVTTFKPHPDYSKVYADNYNRMRRAQTLRYGNGGFYFSPTNTTWFGATATNEPTSGSLLVLPGNTRYLGGSAPDLPKGVVATRSDNRQPADYDTGIGNFPDGPYCGKADEGNLARSWQDEWKVWHYVEPYFSTWVYDPPGDTYFSPNRQIPSPVMFGSLLAPQESAWDKCGWKTLLFCPNPAGDPHRGQQNPPDHLWLDLFNMPVVEPYAISEPFSTDGKVNLNYQIMPFGYIKRSTALRAALHPLRVTAIPSSFTRQIGGATELKYKGVDNDQNLRYLIDRDQTIKAFDDFFDKFNVQHRPNEGFFKSATQICDQFLYPKGRVLPGNKTITFQPGDSAIKQWWRENAVTGDNVREKPYSDLYTRITTKSNTYTVHYRVQTLKQRPYTGNASGADAYYRTWDESRDQVLSEYRGHTTIERYLDPEDPRFSATYSKPDKIDVEKDSLEDAYRFRIIYNKRFSPW